MSEQNYTVSNGCFRYIVPFSFSEETSFEDVCAQVEKQTSWDRCVTGGIKGESDLFNHIRNEILFDSQEGKQAKEKSGCEWIAASNSFSKLRLYYFANDPLKIKTPDETEIEDYFNFTIKSLGLILYRNNIGFIWYELNIPLKEIDTERLKLFQNRVRELNFPLLFFWKESEEQIDPDHKLKKLEPFMFGEWITQKLEFLNVEFFAERSSAYSSALKKARNINMIMSQGKIILSKADRQQENINLPAEKRKVPDKAVLFTYASMYETDGNDPDEHSRCSVTYHLTNGYRNSYKFSDALIPEMKIPFGNVLWFATNEGASYMVWPDKDNKDFFGSNFISKIKTDYFMLYVKVLYQLYSLLNYSKLLREKVAADNTSFSDENPDEGITRIFAEVNLFLAKNMATSVSHIDHQSEFYIYVSKKLHIQENIESVSSGLIALDAIKHDQWQRAETERNKKDWTEEKERDSKIQAIMGFVAVLGLFSALVDSFDFFGRVFKGDEWNNIPAIGIITVAIAIAAVVLVGIFAVPYAFKAVKDAFNRKRNK